MDYRFHTLDVFTDTRFGGNPLAVVLRAEGIESAQMQAIAREFNLSETVFVLRPESAANTAKLRIFTPTRELPFAGHPTVGTAVLLASLDRKPGCTFETTVKLEEKVGLVPVVVRRLGPEPAYGEFTAAKLPVAGMGAPPAQAFAAALGLEAAELAFGSHAPSVFEAGNRFLFVPVGSRAGLKRAKPNPAAWEAIQTLGVVGAVLYCAGASGGADFHVRMFAPEQGIIEDPATGSAAATFPGAFLKAALLADGTHNWTLAQGEDMGRPSIIKVSADVTKGAITAVRVGGQAVPVSEGLLAV